MIIPTLKDLGRSVTYDCYFICKIIEVRSTTLVRVRYNDGSEGLVECQDLEWTNRFTQPQPETTGMNYSTAALLLNPACRAIRVSYEKDKDGKPINFMIKKTFDETITVGDDVVVETSPDHRYGFTTARVTEVDVEWEPDTHENITWIVSKVDVAAYKALKDAEEQTIKLVKDSEKTARREEIKKKAFAHVDQEALSKSALSNMGADTKAIGNS